MDIAPIRIAKAGPLTLTAGETLALDRYYMVRHENRNEALLMTWNEDLARSTFVELVGRQRY